MIPPAWMIEEVALFESAQSFSPFNSFLDFSRPTGYHSAWQQRRMAVFTLQFIDEDDGHFEHSPLNLPTKVQPQR